MIDQEKKKLMPIIKFDFDGTIVTEKFPAIGEPIPLALETIKKMQDHGYNTILWTCREGEALENAVKFLKGQGICFDSVNEGHEHNPYRDLGASRKPFAHYHIDDKNFGGIPHWQEIHDYFFIQKKYHESIGIVLQTNK